MTKLNSLLVQVLLCGPHEIITLNGQPYRKGCRPMLLIMRYICAKYFKVIFIYIINIIANY